VVSPTGSEIAFTTLGRGVTVVRSLGGSPVVGISHQDVIRAIAFNADETVLATGGEDGYARVWDLAGSSDARREMTRIPNRDPVSALAFSGDAEYLVVANDREVRVVRWRSDDLVREACGRISRSLTPEEWKPYLNGESPTPTCPALVEHPGTLLEQAARAISEGRMQDAQSLYRRAKRAGQRPTPADWKKLCWGGSFWGHVNDVWFACKRAVSEEPDEPLYRDARGVARVLRGDRQGALDDFRFFLAKSAGTNIRRECRERRERWIAELERGADPFEAGEMRELWKE